jgi:hypothetical protein
MSKLIRLVVLTITLLALSPSLSGASGVADPCAASGGAYEIGCRLLQGRADGWYPNVSGSREPAVSQVRIVDRYR